MPPTAQFDNSRTKLAPYAETVPQPTSSSDGPVLLVLELGKRVDTGVGKMEGVLEHHDEAVLEAVRQLRDQDGDSEMTDVPWDESVLEGGSSNGRIIVVIGEYLLIVVFESRLG